MAPLPQIFLTHMTPAEIAALGATFTAPVVVDSVEALDAASQSGGVLVSFGTGVIVPSAILRRFEGRAYNLHAASPDYPGRDPHHFAVYDGAGRYGATLHQMTDKVDAGPIVDVELFDVPPGVRPSDLLALANAAALRILQRSGARIAAGEILPPLPAAAWGPIKRSRRDFLAMCRIDPAIDAEEFQRRLHAFDGEAYDNLYVELHGRRFRIEKPDRR